MTERKTIIIVSNIQISCNPSCSITSLFRARVQCFIFFLSFILFFSWYSLILKLENGLIFQFTFGAQLPGVFLVCPENCIRLNAWN